jgi:hypothetical protein
MTTTDDKNPAGNTGFKSGGLTLLEQEAEIIAGLEYQGDRVH